MYVYLTKVKQYLELIQSWFLNLYRVFNLKVPHRKLTRKISFLSHKDICYKLHHSIRRKKSHGIDYSHAYLLMIHRKKPAVPRTNTIPSG
jgi:hypothetical protein